MSAKFHIIQNRDSSVEHSNDSVSVEKVREGEAGGASDIVKVESSAPVMVQGGHSVLFGLLPNYGGGFTKR